MFEAIFRILMWMFAIGGIGCLLLVIPITAWRLFSVLFEKDNLDERNPYQQRM
jgi:hypothetical protein